MTIVHFFDYFLYLINAVAVPLLFGVAFLIFVIGVFQFFFAQDNADKRKKGVTFIQYGIVGFVLMFSLWGIVALLTDSTGFAGQGRPGLPMLPIDRSMQNASQDTSGGASQSTVFPTNTQDRSLGTELPNCAYDKAGNAYSENDIRKVKIIIEYADCIPDAEAKAQATAGN
jgi:hypothetical protein